MEPRSSKKRASSKLSFTEDHDDSEELSLTRSARAGSSSTPVFMPKRARTKPPAAPASLPPVPVSSNSGPSDRSGATDRLQLVDEVLSRFGDFGIDKQFPNELDVSRFRIYLYSVKHGQEHHFFEVPQNSPYRVVFHKRLEALEQASVLLRGSLDTFKDKFVSGGSIGPPIPEEPSDTAKRVVKKVKINPIVLKRLGIEPLPKKL